MTGRDKQRALAWVGIAVAAMILLAAGLPTLDIDAPAGPFPFRLRIKLAPLPELDLPRGELQPISLRGVGIVLLVALPLILIYLIISPEARKRFLRDFGAMLTLFAMFLAIKRLFRQFLAGEEIEVGGPAGGDELLSLAPPAEFLANPPPWLVYGLAALLALLVTALLAGAAWYIWWRGRAEDSALEQLAQEARQAIDALAAGSDLRNAVLRCYQGMLRVLREGQGIERPQAMTPREFERRLAHSGLPQAQVQRLTRLFERVRYGDKAPSPDEEREALDCLAAIAESAGARP